MPFIKAIRLGDFPGQAECLEYMLGALAPDMPAETLSNLKEAVYLREDTASTYLEDGLAVPHGRISGLGAEYVVAGVSSGGVDWPTEDCRANLVVLVAVDRSRVAAYLSILQKIIKWRKSLGGDAAEIYPGEIARGLELALN